MSHDTDVALLRRALRADVRAEQELVRRLMPALRAVARSILGAGSDADDGVQLAMMRVLERATTYRGDAPLEAWARTIGVRACLRHAQGLRRHRGVDEPVDEQVPPEPADDEELIEALPGPIAAYLERLPAVQREAVVLRHALGYSVAEVAELLGVPLDTAKSRLLFGLRSLRKAIRRDTFVGANTGTHGGRRG
ncbi:MAG: RNA polymerase sigma factor [Nannocystaceae bacterium]|nr:RNA polymerase sigma factor [Nannocystaceae bacterium]